MVAKGAADITYANCWAAIMVIGLCPVSDYVKIVTNQSLDSFSYTRADAK